MKSTKAPFRVGDTIRLLHESRHGTSVADLPVIRVTQLSDGRSWRITARRDHETCPEVDVTVNEAGADRDGYVGRPTGVRMQVLS